MRVLKLDNEIKAMLKKELTYLVILLLAFIVVFKLMFYKENFIVVTKTVWGIFFLFFVPGYCLTLRWHNRLNFVVRLVMGIGISAALLGMLSYYLGLMGANVNYLGFILPPILMIFGVLFLFFIQKKPQE